MLLSNPPRVPSKCKIRTALVISSPKNCAMAAFAGLSVCGRPRTINDSLKHFRSKKKRGEREHAEGMIRSHCDPNTIAPGRKAYTSNMASEKNSGTT